MLLIILHILGMTIPLVHVCMMLYQFLILYSVSYLNFIFF